jgi:hypothetical protein
VTCFLAFQYGYGGPRREATNDGGTCPRLIRHMFCIDSKKQIGGTSGGLGMFGADKVRV